MNLPSYVPPLSHNQFICAFTSVEAEGVAIRVIDADEQVIVLRDRLPSVEYAESLLKRYGWVRRDESWFLGHGVGGYPTYTFVAAPCEEHRETIGTVELVKTSRYVVNPVCLTFDGALSPVPGRVLYGFWYTARFMDGGAPAVHPLAGVAQVAHGWLILNWYGANAPQRFRDAPCVEAVGYYSSTESALAAAIDLWKSSTSVEPFNDAVCGQAEKAGEG